MLRRDMDAGVITKQLQRTLHAFDGVPRRILFSWPGTTPAISKYRRPPRSSGYK
ncbi:hypothetical protein [Pseudomonas oryzihabitans]|uniref:hypothetical protein n=1 Tax=Pseudomonas oryzihabitans TaxID=47885 RepID=UPI0016428272|nr:hypothetical protein [Pseudomonas oryzihabitans]